MEVKDRKGRFTELTEAVVLDTETTGTDTKNDRVIEIAALVVDFTTLEPDAEQTVKCFHSRINPEQPILKEAQAVHGISEEDLKDEPPFANIAETLRDFIGNRPLVGHNVSFDKKMLHAEFKRAGLKGIWHNPTYCTMKRLGYYLLSNKAGHTRISLDRALNCFSIEGRTGKDHGALEDVQLTLQLASVLRAIDELPGSVVDRWESFFGPSGYKERTVKQPSKTTGGWLRRFLNSIFK